MIDYRRAEDKEMIKAALKEWLDEKFSEFGRWTLKSLAALLFGATIVWLVNHGWVK